MELDTLDIRPLPGILLKHFTAYDVVSRWFEAIFEEECQRRGIKLFVLPPRSPKLNGGVERANRTHTEEFYEVTDSTFELADLRPKLLQWENICNTYRPSQALNYLTPKQFLEQQNNGPKKEVRCHQCTERVHALALCH